MGANQRVRFSCGSTAIAAAICGIRRNSELDLTPQVERGEGRAALNRGATTSALIRAVQKNYAAHLAGGKARPGFGRRPRANSSEALPPLLQRSKTAPLRRPSKERAVAKVIAEAQNVKAATIG